MVRGHLAGWAVAGALLAACSAPPAPPALPAPPPDLGPAVIVPGGPGEPARVLSGAEAAAARPPEVVSPADVEFVSMMVPHHEQALLMSGLAPERATDARVRAMAGRIAAAQGPEIAVLRAWLDQQAGGAGPMAMGGMGGMSGMASAAQLDALAAARGPAFDRRFLELMIAHHRGALDMAGRAQVAGTDVAAQQIADDIVATQSAEITRMEDLLGPPP